MAALLSSLMGDSDKIAQYIRECNRLQIKVLQLDINSSFKKFSVEDDTIRYGLLAVKNVGEGFIEDIVRAKKNGKFKTFSDFIQRITDIENHSLNKKAVESLIKAGAFDSLNLKRSQLMSVYEKTISDIIYTNKKKISGQVSLFEISEETETFDVMLEMDEFNEFELLRNEKEVLGVYLSSHPLNSYEKYIEKNSNFSTIIFETDDNNSYEKLDGKNSRTPPRTGSQSRHTTPRGRQSRTRTSRAVHLTLKSPNSTSKLTPSLCAVFSGADGQTPVDRLLQGVEGGNAVAELVASQNPRRARRPDAVSEDVEKGQRIAGVHDGNRMRFRVVLNPVKTFSKGVGNRGETKPIYMTEEQMNYLIERAEKNGFLLNAEDFSVVEKGNVVLKKANQSSTRLNKAVYEGTLTISDVELFKNILTLGMGKHKAYGFGMITVIPMVD